MLLLLSFPLWLVDAPTKECAHPYSMMHRRLTTAGIEVAPHYHQLLVLEIVYQYCPCSCSGKYMHIFQRWEKTYWYRYRIIRRTARPLKTEREIESTPGFELWSSV